MSPADRIVDFLEMVPDAILALRERQTIALLQATRPGRHSRRIYTRAMEGAVSDGAEFRRAVRGILVPPAARPWKIDPPDAAVLAKLNRALAPKGKQP